VCVCVCVHYMVYIVTLYEALELTGLHQVKERAIMSKKGSC